MPDSVILTQHIGSHTDEGIHRMSVAAARNLVAVLRGEHPEGVVNEGAYGARGT